jgi:VWFA-related protein
MVATSPEHAPMRTNDAQLQAFSKLDSAAHEIYDAVTESPSIPGGQAIRDQMRGISLEDFFSDLGETVDDSSNLYAGIEYLRHVDGEKHLVWLTDLGLRLTGVLVPAEFERDIARTAADGRVVLDVIRAGGVEFESPLAASNRAGSRSGLAPTMGGGSIWPAAASRTLAELTGGRSDANRFPNSSIAADYIDQASRFQYLLGYTSSDDVWNGRFRTVKVTVNRPGVTVLVRGGYYARKDIGPLDRRAVLTHSRVSAAAGDAREIHDLGIRGRASNGGAVDGRTVTIDATLDLSRVTFQTVGGLRHAEIEVQAFVLDKRQQPLGDTRTLVVLDYSEDRLAAARTAGAAIHLIVPAAGVVDPVKLVAYDYVDDLTGSVNLSVGK